MWTAQQFLDNRHSADVRTSEASLLAAMQQCQREQRELTALDGIWAAFDEYWEDSSQEEAEAEAEEGDAAGNVSHQGFPRRPL